MSALLHINNLSVDFVSEKERTHAVKNISLTVNRGEIVALVGESGSGKSVTSLSILQLLPQPPAQYISGQILFTEKEQTLDLLTLSINKLQHIRGNKIAMIFQEPMTSLNPVISCGKQVMEALLQHKTLTTSEAKRQAIDWLRKVKLPEPEKIFYRYPHQLSGGQKQRIMIAMSICCTPALLICDEPTTALDVTVQKSILELIKELQQEHNMGVLFITHDLGVVAELADKVAIMYQGAIVEYNTTSAIFHHPAETYTKALLACRPGLHRKGEKLPVVSDYLDNKNKVVESIQVKEEKKVQPYSDPSPYIRVEKVSVLFPTQKNILGTPTHFYTAVNDVSFDILKGETLGLVGESGCGKTTLGRVLLRLIAPTKGKIIFHHTDITTLEKKDLKKFRQEVQLVFQDPFSSLNPRLTIGEAIEEPLKIYRITSTAAERKKQTADLLNKVQLPATFAQRYPHEFSGGQRQRIVIARALALHPHFLVCDESVSALDVSVQAQVLNLLNDLKKELGLTLLFISHDLSVVRYMSDRIMVMHQGKIVESGPSEVVYQHPSSAYTQILLAAIPKVIPH